MKKRRLLVFDWDGTLFDSTAHIAAALNAAFTRCRLEVPGERAASVIGLSLKEAFLNLQPGLSEEEIAALTDSYREEYLKTEAETGFFPGIEEMLCDLRESDCLAIATGKSRAGLNRVLARIGHLDFFDFTVCADETTPKPHPAMMKLLLKKSGLRKSEAFMTGDTTYDLEMAARAGVTPLAVSWGAHRADLLQGLSPEKIFDRVADLHRYLAPT